MTKKWHQVSAPGAEEQPGPGPPGGHGLGAAVLGPPEGQGPPATASGSYFQNTDSAVSFEQNCYSLITLLTVCYTFRYEFIIAGGQIFTQMEKKNPT